MPPKDDPDAPSPPKQQQQQQPPPPKPSSSRPRSAFSAITTVPAPVKRLFDKFPLVTYPANELPLRAPRERQRHQLYIFTTEDGARKGEPSFNPTCLKWQAYFKFSGVDFVTVASSNHASPSGALPFLLPGGANASILDQPHVVPSGKMQKWVMDNGRTPVEEPDDDRFEAYMSLLDHDIRRAWLYTLYLTRNFDAVAQPLYIDSTSSNAVVRASVSRELRAAAQAELLKHGAVVDAETIYSAAEDALRALESALGADRWFFGARRPGVFDAAVFAYTHLLLTQDLGGAGGWAKSRLGDAVRARQRLVRHQERVSEAFFHHGA
ncbi:putative mitochondrial outer membrane protein [Diplodia seriata]|uniref:Metaxin-1 n=1 Tax=Diplodia seriata TaxID=420778 RepID=A0A0G2GLP7_9PEZI|nr:putative mitochondrial outer membrane protein [Diplodia seriata]OMP83085.1 Metaxin-1 [Diplodia seriata]